MSLVSVKAFFAERAPDISIEDLSQSTATVVEAAQVHGVQPAQIAKTLALRVGEKSVVLVTRGDARLDNGKAKAVFGSKVRMLGAEEVVAITGHPIGGVCPFGLAEPLAVYLDETLQAFPEVIAAAGSAQTTVRITPQRMAELCGALWVDVCQDAISAPQS